MIRLFLLTICDVASRGLSACSCAGPSTADETWERSNAVFTGVVLAPLLLIAMALAGCGTAVPPQKKTTHPFGSAGSYPQAPHRQCAEYWTEPDPEIELPRAIRRVQPDPIPHGQRSSLVCVAVLVDVEGRVVDTDLRYTDDRPFARNAEATLRKWRFEPGTRDGEPVETWMLITISVKR